MLENVRKCIVTDCTNKATCIGTQDGIPCCDDHCSHDGDGSEHCSKNTWGDSERVKTTAKEKHDA